MFEFCLRPFTGLAMTCPETVCRSCFKMAGRGLSHRAGRCLSHEIDPASYSGSLNEINICCSLSLSLLCIYIYTHIHIYIYIYITHRTYTRTIYIYIYIYVFGGAELCSTRPTSSPSTSCSEPSWSCPASEVSGAPAIAQKRSRV